MAQYKVTDTELSGIASAIRLKGGTSEPLVFPSGFVSAISAIETGGEPPVLISKIITSNGEYDPSSDNADAFSHVTVSVPTESTPVLVSKSILENGTYNPSDDNADAYSQVVVNVSGGGGGDGALLEGILTGTVSELYTIASGSLRSYAFTSQRTVLASVNMPNITSIGGSAFNDCRSLQTVSFDNCLYIGGYAFQNCSMLQSVSFPACTNIGSGAFDRCSSLRSAIFPQVQSILGNAFSGCTSLSYFSASNCIYVDAYAFYKCTSLSDVHLPNCSYVNSSAFDLCSNLKEISLPECSYIGPMAFSNCSSLEVVYLTKCKTLSNRAFTKCNRLKSLYLLSTSIVNIPQSQVFESTPIALSSYLGYYGSIYVPASLVDAYKSATYWSYYSDRITSYVEG